LINIDRQLSKLISYVFRRLLLYEDFKIDIERQKCRKVDSTWGMRQVLMQVWNIQSGRRP